MTVDRDRVTDERLVFYLERRELIDEWAKLNELEKVAAHQFLLDLGSEIAHRAAQHDPSVRSEFLALESAEQFHVLYRPEWLPGEPVEPLLPRAVICIAWWKSVRLIATSSGPSVGVRTLTTSDRDVRRRLGDRIDDGAIGKAAFPGGNPRSMSPWIRNRTILPSGDRYWENLRPYGDELVDILLAAWDEFSPVVDEVLSTA